MNLYRWIESMQYHIPFLYTFIYLFAKSNRFPVQKWNTWENFRVKLYYFESKNEIFKIEKSDIRIKMGLLKWNFCIEWRKIAVLDKIHAKCHEKLQIFTAKRPCEIIFQCQKSYFCPKIPNFHDFWTQNSTFLR